MENDNLNISGASEALKLKMKLWKKILLGFAISIFAIGLLLYFFWYLLITFNSEDSPLVDNSNLLLREVSVPDEDNAFFDLSSITDDMIYEPEFDGKFNMSMNYTNFVEPVEWDQNLVDEVLQKNQQALALFNSAANKNYFQVPEYADPSNFGHELKVYPMNHWREVSRLQAIKALSLMRQGNGDEALTEAVKLNKVGHIIIAGQGFLIEDLVGISMQNLGSEVVLQILSNTGPSFISLKEALQTIQDTSDNVDGHKGGLKGEYTGVINTIDMINEDVAAMAKEELGKELEYFTAHSYYYKPNQTKNLYTRFYGYQINGLGKGCQPDDSILQQLDSMEDFGGISMLTLVFKENLIGKILFSMNGAIVYESYLTKICNNDFLNNIVQVQLALKQYQYENGYLPNFLEDLAPQYIDEIPVDPYSKQPIRYSVKNKTLHSLGAGNQDLSGSNGADWRKMSSPTFFINF